MMNRSKLWAVLLLAAAFAAGVAVGNAVSSARGAETSEEAAPKDRNTRYLERLDQELTLSPAQRDSVRTIMDRHQAEMRALWQEIGPRFDSLRTTIRSEIATVLDDAQRPAFQALNVRSDSARAERRQGGPHGH